MSPTYDYLHTNTAVKKNGEIHLGMLPFITPFALLDEKVNGQQITSLIYEDVNVNHNTIRPAMAYEICNNTDDYEANNVVLHSSGHEVDISKEFQLVFLEQRQGEFLFRYFNQYNCATYLLSVPIM